MDTRVAITESKIESLAKDSAKQTDALSAALSVSRDWNSVERAKLRDEVNAVRSAANTQNERIARMEAGQEYIIRQLDRILQKLENNSGN